ncbi:MAG TPA: CAP domain-containing protein [Terriglobales bacterium]|nr:CAP domain-containing protein [Terriglobales bacterium]
MKNLLVFLCGVGVFLSGPEGHAAAAGSYDPAAEQKIFQLLNQARAQRGLPALEENAQLQQAARSHSQLMASRQKLSHQFRGEAVVRERLAMTGLHFDNDGENVGLHQTAEGAHQGFMHSPPHRANILNPEYNAVGIGVVERGGNIWVTEDFARTFAEYSASGVEEIVAGRVSELRGRAGVPAIGRRFVSALRQDACSMAHHDKLDPRLALHLPDVRQAATFTSTEPQMLPGEATAIARQRDARGFAVGACFARTRKYPAGAYWVVLVTY